MNNKTIILISIFVHLLLFGSSQSNLADQFFQQKIEELSENSSAEIDFSDLTDELVELKEKPINLNKTTVGELRKLPFLSEKQIENLILYIETYGEILSVNELQAINGFDTTTIRLILPFMTVRPDKKQNKISFPDLITSGHGQLLFRYQQILQEQEGYSGPDSVIKINPNAAYCGSPQKYYFRFNYNYHDRIIVGLTGEKDPGEEFFKGNQRYGMDYYGGYLCLKNTGILKSLVIGNFNADFGQGLTLSSGLSFGSLSSSGNLRRYAGRIKPSLSVNENSFLRGIAVNLAFKRIELACFYSRHKRDANIMVTDSVSGNASKVSSFQETGYHRLQSEMNDKNAINEEIFGGNIQFRNNFLSIGSTVLRSHWNAVLDPEPEVYSRFAFNGNSNLNAGLDLQFIYRTIYGFGEVSGSINGGLAWLAGIQVNPDPAIHFSLIYRDYRRNYQNLLGNAIGQNSKNSNERGILLSFSSRLSSQIGLSAFVDIFEFPWLKYRADFPVRGSEFSLQTDYSPSTQLSMMLKYRFKQSQLNDDLDQLMHKWINTGFSSLRYQVDWQINSFVHLKNRFEMIRTSGEGSKPSYGYFVSQDISSKPPKIPVTISFRYAIFNTDNYDTRIYSFENDVLYSTSVPALDGTGIRCFLLASWEPFRCLVIWFRYTQSFYTDRDVIGTGLEMVNGPLKSEIKIQAQLKF